MISKAAAQRFLRANEGRTFLTTQKSPRGVWEPGPRVLRVRGGRFLFDESTFRFEAGMTVLDLTDTSVTIAYPPERDMTVTYRLAGTEPNASTI